MRKIHTKLLIALLLAALLLPVFAGCDKTPADTQTGDTTPADNGEAVTTPPAEETTAPVINKGEFVALLKDGKPVSRVLFDAAGGQSTLNAAKEISTAIKELGGVSPSVYSADKAQAFDGIDILINVTSRPETKTAMEGLSLGEYRIGFYSGALVIVADDPAATVDAVKHLSEILKQNKADEGEVGVYDQMVVNGVYNLPLSLILPEKSAKSTAIFYNGDDSYTVTFDNVNKATYDSYNAALATRGMTKYTDNEINGNYFVTYTGKDCVVNSIFIAYSNEMRVITEPLAVTALPPLESDTAADAKKVEPMITQIGLEVPGNTTDYINGMSYLIRMEDGRFIVIDGGHPRAENAGNIFKIMRVQAPDVNNMVIAAWIFTHPHTDHAGAFRKWSAYSKNVKIEKFIFNFPDENKSPDNKVMLDYITGIKNEIAKMYPDAIVYKAHAGQTYAIGTANIEILYSLELFTPADINENYNCTSLMFSFELAGYKTIFLGDCTIDTSGIMCKMYGKTLDADFVQVGHHGATGAVAELYVNISPAYVLWPISEYKYNAGYKMAAQNAYFRVTPTVKQICIAGDNIWTVNLSGNEPVFTMFDNIVSYK